MRDRGAAAARFRLAVRWLRQPWTDLALVLALVGASAAPSFLTASADIRAAAAADRIVATLVTREDDRSLGISVETNAVFAPGGSAPIDAVTERIAAVGPLTAPVPTLATFTGLLTAEEPVLGSPVRLISRPGAVEALVVVDRAATAGGVWISDWLAEKGGIRPGDTITFTSDADPNTPGADIVGGGGSRAQFVVAGTYRRLWTEDNARPAPYWRDLPTGLLPRFIAPFGGPGFELLVSDPSTLESSGLPGMVRWDAAIAERPATLPSLMSLASEYRAVETDLATGDAATALASLAAGGPARPIVTSAVPDLTLEARSNTARLSQPIGTARAAGVALALAVMAAAGALIVQRRRTEFRLLAGEGDRWPIIGLRTAGQLLGPVGLGAALGVVLAGGFPGGSTRDSVDWPTAATVTLAGLLCAVTATAFAGQRVLTTSSRKTAVLPVLAVATSAGTGFLWLQVDRTATGSTLDLAVVTLPMMALLAAGSIGTSIMVWVLSRFGSAARRLPPVAFLAWRHLSRRDGTGPVVAVALGVGIGLVALSTHLVDTLQRTIDVKIATEIGGETRLDVFGPAPFDLAPPADSTFVRFQETRLTPGDTPVRVVAIDPRTAEALTWPTEFGPTLTEVVTTLDRLLDDGAVPALAVEGRAVATEGTFGTGQPIRYRVVGTVRSSPLAASVGPTLLVAAPQVDLFEIARATAGGAEMPEGFQPPTSRYRRHLVSMSTPGELAGYLAANDLEIREVFTRSSRSTDPDVVAPALAFDYLGSLGYVAAVAAAAALALYLSVRRRARALGSVMMRRMGFTPGAVAAATDAEVAVLLGVASAASMVVVPLVSGVLARRFDPAPSVPPAVDPAPVTAAIWTTMSATVAAVTAAVWLIEWRSARRSGAEVLRG
ncbi:MAG: hypothetical protein ACFCVC_18785 [Acidimicrobiia bacterium]